MSKLEFPIDRIERKILVIRGHRVMLDKDLAFLYQVKPIALRQQVKRNKDRFPSDFMFQLTKDEIQILLSQNVIPSINVLGGFLPHAFTQEGISMLSSVLRSHRAIQVNIHIMRAFVRLRQMMVSYADLERKIENIEKKYDSQFKVVFVAIRELMTPAKKSNKKIGFVN